MPLLKLTGEDSTLTLHLEHPLHLEKNVKYQLGLVGFYSENNIYNLQENATIRFWDKDISSLNDTLIITAGYWTVEKLQNSIVDFIASLKLNVDSTKFQIRKVDDRINLWSPLKFHLDEEISKLLGFHPPQKQSNVIDSYYDADTTVVAQNPPNLRAVDVIEIHCNAIENSYVKHSEHDHKHSETAILYSFFPDAPHGYKISEVPRERLYLPVRKGMTKLQRVTVNITNHRDLLVKNSGVNNIVYLHLKTE